MCICVLKGNCRGCYRPPSSYQCRVEHSTAMHHHFCGRLSRVGKNSPGTPAFSLLELHKGRYWSKRYYYLGLVMSISVQGNWLIAIYLLFLRKWKVMNANDLTNENSFTSTERYYTDWLLWTQGKRTKTWDSQSQLFKASYWAHKPFSKILSQRKRILDP